MNPKHAPTTTATLPRTSGLTALDLRALGICKIFEVARQFSDVCETRVRRDAEGTEFVITFRRKTK